MDRERFRDQVAVVSGAADGIGRGVAARLAREGAEVIAVDRDEGRLDETVSALREEGLSVGGAIANIADEEQVRRAFEGVESSHGRLDIVVNCAAVAGPTGIPIAEVSVGDFERACSVNYGGSFIVTKQAIRMMLPRNYGRILLFASIAGKEGNPSASVYSSTKAAVIGLAKSAGKEYARAGITVNAIAPAVIRTRMVEETDPKLVDYMIGKIPMNRCGEIEEAAAMAAWIVSKECSFTTGFVFDLTGGRATY